MIDAAPVRGLETAFDFTQPRRLISVRQAVRGSRSRDKRRVDYRPSGSGDRETDTAAVQGAGAPPPFRIRIADLR